MRFPLILLKAVILAPILSTGYLSAAQANSANNNGSQSTSGPGLFKPIVIDFEDFDAGTFITGDEWADLEGGLNISVESNRKQKADSTKDLPLRLYDTNCRPAGITDPSFQSLPICSGGDGDLATGDYFGSKEQGNVLIIQEDNSKRRNRDNLGAPDDERKGGTITFRFNQAIQYISLGFLDFDEHAKGEFRFYSKADDTTAALNLSIKDVQAINPAFSGDNSLRLFENVQEGMEVAFERLEVEFPGSGAITHLCFSPEIAPGGSHNWADEADSCRW
ncbi:MAG: hypothetical protein F6K00_06885 [Leptolyngbya sp. SIOISBB]|nr:hypothetical protein [Leptolyngbya sp. SIOISBB]